MQNLIKLLLTGLTMSLSANTETITLGAGCFWCVEAVYHKLDGVQSAVSGYMGGHVDNPTYEQVCGKKSGHIEVVQVKYDSEKVSTEEILAWFWKLHDPTTKDRQGNDEGPQYASAIFYHSPEQQRIAQASLEAAQPDFAALIVTYVREAETFYPAEDYHQNYYELNKSRNPYCRYVIAPKMKKLNLDK